eukprot:CAMPEP_0172539914 /NCGR_PEP_ID=MMETSP1067-20121228/11023_1 /TAXON_ID=265564 ORGANISM="Thalassiosira punctigera, Strain Tpunct2005C2" /NCGR_SAMPLE_ID=MMETSP1067 /ASSEMBLY_ACC=CAM_ASM_000444 /LENGTH=126 /DNA_ID=CAMNT_0013325669 /DNA_START=120 /DNA_END=497 /DNA_ORIENTATION=+
MDHLIPKIDCSAPNDGPPTIHPIPNCTAIIARGDASMPDYNSDDETGDWVYQEMIRTRVSREAKSKRAVASQVKCEFPAIQNQTSSSSPRNDAAFPRVNDDGFNEKQDARKKSDAHKRRAGRARAG